MNWPQREQTITRLLRDAAEPAPTEVDLAPRLRQRLAATTLDDQGRATAHPQARRRSPRWALGGVAAALVAALLLSAFAFAQPLIFSWFGDSGLRGIALQDGTLINRSATSQGVTVHLEQGYADAARTALTMRFSSADTQHLPTPNLDALYLVDAQGHRSFPLYGSQDNADSLMLFSPLAQNELSTEQPLTLVIQAMLLNSGASTTSVAGQWDIPFHLLPRAGRTVSFAAAPQTQNGVTMQPLRLDLAPTGARLLVRVSGLPADTSLFGLAHFSTQQPVITGCPPGSGACVSSGGSGDGATMRLRGADGQSLTPSWVVVATNAAPDVALPPSATQTVGAGGAAVVEFLFFTPLRTTHGVAQVTLAQIEVASVIPNGPSGYVNGPWTFALPL